TGARLLGRGIWLTNGNYTFSIYLKCPAGAAGPIRFGLVNGDDLAPGVNPPTNVTVSSSWARYTCTNTITSNAFYWPKIVHDQPRVLVDAIQLEPGLTLSAYAPQSTVECGLTSAGTNNLWFLGDSPTFTINLWNEGTASNGVAQCDVVDGMNSNVMTTNVTVTLGAATATVSSVALPPRIGWFRVTSRLTTVNDSADEMTCAVYPYASNITADATTDWLGGHPHSSNFHTRREMLVNRKFGRLLSPDYQPLRWDYIEPTRGAMTFYNFGITNTLANGLKIIAPLTPTDGLWPQWATNGDGTWDQNAWSNYCYRVVDRYKSTNIWWEIGPNEPFQSGPTTPINVQVATNYAKVLQVGIRGVTNADPTAHIIAIAGAYGGGDWAMEVWTNISAASQAAIEVISTHQYPDDNGTDPNLAHDPSVHFTNPYGWITLFGGIRPVWNTESGTYGFGAIKSKNGIWPGAYNVQSSPSPEAVRNEVENRQTASTMFILAQFLRCKGAGMDKVVYYDSRYFNDSSFSGNQPYGNDYEQVDNPQNVALSVATFFLRKGFGRVNNPATTALEMYSYTNASGNPVITAWNWDRTNRIVTVTNSGFTVYDAMGNQVQTGLTTAKVTRFPQYFVSTTLTQAQLSNTLANAAVVGTADVLPPKISFDIAPSGIWDGATNAQFVKWTALDDTWTAWNTAATATNVLYKWKLDAGSYSTYSQSNHVWLSNLSSGNHTVSVTAIDASGNNTESVYYFFATNSSPTTVTNPSLNVFGTLTVGALNLGQ